MTTSIRCFLMDVSIVPAYMTAKILMINHHLLQLFTVATHIEHDTVLF